MQKKDRHGNILIWRQFLVTFARLEGMRIARAGEIVNQDHSTVIHAIKCINSRVQSSQYPEYLEVLNDIKYHIEQNIASSEDMNINEMNCLILLDQLIAKKYEYANIN